MITSSPHHSVFVCGATAFAIGIAVGFGEGHLITDSCSVIASEFIDSYNTGDGNWEVASNQGELFKQELVKRNILSENGLVHIPAVAPVLLKLIHDNNLNILFDTNIIGVKNNGHLFEITIFNSFGFQKVTADRIIDTTSHCVSYPNMRKHIVSKSINSMLHCPEQRSFPFESANINSGAGASFHRGKFEEEIIFKLKIHKDDDWSEARHKLHTFWTRRPDILKPWSIAAVSSTFDITLDGIKAYEIQSNWQWFPSCAYNNLLSAFDSGIFASKGGVCL